MAEPGQPAAPLAGITVVTLEQAAQIVELQIGGILLPFDNPELAGTTVGEVLADPARFRGRDLSSTLSKKARISG